jgi:D-ornithine 4,5-aminomutase subunit alpha
MKRNDDYPQRRKELVDISDARLEQRFWELAECVTAPLVELARTHTSPSIERSVLLRMGFSSLEAKEIVHHCQKYGLLGKGAGHVLLRFARSRGMGIREAGLMLGQGTGWDEAAALFRKAVQVWN